MALKLKGLHKHCLLWQTPVVFFLFINFIFFQLKQSKVGRVGLVGVDAQTEAASWLCWALCCFVGTPNAARFFLWALWVFTALKSISEQIPHETLSSLEKVHIFVFYFELPECVPAATGALHMSFCSCSTWWHTVLEVPRAVWWFVRQRCPSQVAFFGGGEGLCVFWMFWRLSGIVEC